ncbi:MFS transporter [Parvicella tangerina]|uniref:MFS-type transporter YfcJ n=1 Tax=Parvicella tangerina TaxID=2829795 RepID=A0A916JMH0_9FLAO|nr:MFS transporter [Parvicella tangerina]CAG5081653.1 putative MFS-type transporter YfcJ [Parvicella tangerina]
MDQIKLGTKENWQQFTLLVIVNALVGAMIGTERSIFAEYAVANFDLSGQTAFMSFIIVFGIAKAISNYQVGKLFAKYGRKKMLIVGWLVVLPVPLIFLYANHWYLVVLANVLLGISQGFAWSSTIVMKIDLVGPKNRGFAMGLNEFAGYAAVGVMALVTGWIAEHYSILPYVFYLAFIIAWIGLFLSVLFVKDTTDHVLIESSESDLKMLSNIANETTFKHKTLSSVTQAGFVNNMNDGMLWGLLPVLLISKGFSLDTVGLVVFIYPFVWGVGQLFTGKMSDHFNLKKMLFFGMLLQGFAIISLYFYPNYINYILSSIVLGIGTALVYPTFFTVISKVVHPEQRAESIGVFRLYRDGGYAAGAFLAGLLADIFSVGVAVLITGIITLLSAIVIQVRMKPVS